VKTPYRLHFAFLGLDESLRTSRPLPARRLAVPPTRDPPFRRTDCAVILGHRDLSTHFCGRYMASVLERLRAGLGDRYAVEGEIGRGGMAMVFRAEDLRHRRKVAIKVLHPDLAASMGAERFLHEVEVVAGLQHPHILTLYESGECDGLLYYVMPYVDGPSLRQRLDNEIELPIGDVVRILRDIADALSEAHAQGVVHRDIKPENVLLRGRHALVTDFGVAKAVSEATGRVKLTTAGVVLGTPAYMAPEQATGGPILDHRVDIYALGALAYELLTGRKVFEGATAQAILSAHLTQEPRPVSQLRAMVPPALEALVMRCLAKSPADRWQRAEEMLPQLEALAATPSGGITPTDTRPLPAVSARRRRRWPVATVGFIALVAIGLLLLRSTRGPQAMITTTDILPVTSDPWPDLHPALSPDGSQVAFSSLREDNRRHVVIRSAISVGGSNELLPTSGQPSADEWLPTWSPDGEFVRFWRCPEKGACSWSEVSRLGGSIRSLNVPGRGASCAWSADGSSVACLVWPDSVFIRTPADPAPRLAAIHETNWAIHSPAWSPNGERIAYVDGNPPWRWGFNVAASSIWVLDVGSGSRIRITGDEYMDVSPTWLDDDRLLFVSNRSGPREAWLVEVGPDGPRAEAQKVPGVSDPHSISYSPSRGNLAFSKARGRQNLQAYPMERAPVSVLAGRPVTRDNAVVDMADVSPDGRWIVFDSNLRGNMDIYRMPLGGGAPMPITDRPEDDFYPAWSPDGREIAFYGNNEEAGESVMTVPVSGGTPLVVSGGPSFNDSPNWSPDGLELLFHSTRTGHDEAWLVSRADAGATWGEPRQLTKFGCYSTDWTPDGEGVLCRSGRAFVLVARNGAILWRRNLPAGLAAVNPIAKFSADGSAILVYASARDGTEGIWAIPVEGGEPRLVVSDDDPLHYLAGGVAVTADSLYVTVGEAEGDIWVLYLELGE